MEQANHSNTKQTWCDLYSLSTVRIYLYRGTLVQSFYQDANTSHLRHKLGLSQRQIERGEGVRSQRDLHLLRSVAQLAFHRRNLQGGRSQASKFLVQNKLYTSWHFFHSEINQPVWYMIIGTQTLFGLLKEFSSITLPDVRTVAVDPSALTLAFSPLVEIVRLTVSDPKFTTCTEASWDHYSLQVCNPLGTG